LITRIQELSSNSVAPHFGLPGKQILVSQGFAVGTSPGSVEEKLDFNGFFVKVQSATGDILGFFSPNEIKPSRGETKKAGIKPAFDIECNLKTSLSGPVRKYCDAPRGSQGGLVKARDRGVPLWYGAGSGTQRRPPCGT